MQVRRNSWHLQKKKQLETEIFKDKEVIFGAMEMSPPRSHANGETSSAGNVRTKRKRGDSSNCHQCRRNDKGRVVRCTKFQKNYCIGCITRWYSWMGEASFAEACAKCRKICNCKACLQSDAAKKDLPSPDLELCDKDEIQYSRYTLRVLTPFLKQFVAEQNMEREEAAKVPGLGVTGQQQLPELNSNWVSELLAKAEPIAEVGREVSEGACSCLRSDTKLCKAGDLKHFQWHLKRGEPIIVPCELSVTPGVSWEPMVMWRACRIFAKTNQAHMLDFVVQNCSNWCEETINMHQFLKGCIDGLFDGEGRLKMLKLEDWPPSESFQERLPRHSAEFIRCLPFKQYTHPTGYLNLFSRMPQMPLKPELGPKMCIGYGAEEELGCDVVTKLQYALSDRVNVLMYTAASALKPEELSMIERLRRTHGAVWDVFRRQDVHLLEEYLRNHLWEFRHNHPLQQLDHPIHEKAFYLTAEHKRNLKREYGIEPWTFIQRLGHAVFVPAGCPYQIRNLKSCISIGVNFVSPESVGECIRLSAEYRTLPDNHPFKEDKLQVKKMMLNAVSQAVEHLDSIAPNNSNNNNNTPSTSANQAPYGLTAPPDPATSLELKKQGLEYMIWSLENEPHRIRFPHMVPDAVNQMRTLLEQINALIREQQASSSAAASSSQPPPTS